MKLRRYQAAASSEEDNPSFCANAAPILGAEANFDGCQLAPLAVRDFSCGDLEGRTEASAFLSRLSFWNFCRRFSCADRGDRKPANEKPQMMDGKVGQQSFGSASPSILDAFCGNADHVSCEPPIATHTARDRLGALAAFGGMVLKLVCPAVSLSRENEIGRILCCVSVLRCSYG